MWLSLHILGLIYSSIIHIIILSEQNISLHTYGACLLQTFSTICSFSNHLVAKYWVEKPTFFQNINLSADPELPCCYTNEQCTLSQIWETGPCLHCHQTLSVAPYWRCLTHYAFYHSSLARYQKDLFTESKLWTRPLSLMYKCISFV